MAKKSKLLAALDAHKGRDYEAEKRKKQVKAAEKRKKDKATRRAEEDKENDDLKVDTAQDLAQEDGFEPFSDDEADGGIKLNGTILATTEDVADESNDEDEDENEDDEEISDAISLSSLSASDLSDTIPHQRLTINNGPALLSARSRISLLRHHPTPSTAPFHIHNSLISSLPPASETIPDPNDDLKREASFYAIARAAALEARTLLKSEGIPFTRPADYFAEMVKTESHMGKIQDKARREASERKGREDARQQREARKFGKQVQRLKEEERARTKRETLDKIKDLKRKRKGNPSEDIRENPDGGELDDMFEKIDVEKSGPKDRSGRERGGPASGVKRRKKDAKFGFGGKKRFSKSGDAKSSGDLSGFSSAKMKGKPKRPGKARRAAGR